MTYIHFIGIDVSKNWFDVALEGSAAKPTRFQNSEAGFAAFSTQFGAELPEALIVCEATGGYEMALLRFLITQYYHVHRARPLMVKNFIRSLSQKAKTDALDAKSLARFAKDRHFELAVFVLPDEKQSELNELLMRRSDLIAMRVAEKNRSKQPRYTQATKKVGASVTAMLKFIEADIADIEARLDDLLKESEPLKERFRILTKMTGVAKISAYNLQALMPELGTLTRKTAASLAGCAPFARDSGNGRGNRTTFGGRAQLKRTLFMIAMTARRYDPKLKEFYEKLVANGKKKMVALVAVMRKIIVILNAKLKITNTQTTW
jgi:transposase